MADTSWDSFTTAKQMKFKSKIEKTMSDIFSDVITQDEVEDYTPQLRGSSLPICILLHAQSLLKPFVRDKPAKLDQYSEFGTAAHNLFQKKFLYSKKWGKYLFGDFECENEHIAYTFCTRPKDFKTHVCKVCGKHGLRYRELEAKYKNTLGIHVDTVLKFSEDKYWVIEYKTCGSFKIKDNTMEVKNKHHHQASSYPIVLEEEFGIKAERFFIIYVNRDAPQFSATAQRQHRVFPFKTNTNIMAARKYQLDQIVEGEKARIKYFSNPTIKNLKNLDDLRPCKSKSDYYEPLMGVNDGYEKGDGCPYALKKGCSCFQTENLSKAARDLHKMIKDKQND